MRKGQRVVVDFDGAKIEGNVVGFRGTLADEDAKRVDVSFADGSILIHTPQARITDTLIHWPADNPAFCGETVAHGESSVRDAITCQLCIDRLANLPEAA